MRRIDVEVAVSVRVWVSYARWAKGRPESLARLLRSMGEDPAPRILASAQKEHASIWADRLWRVALESRAMHASEDATHMVFLNDDVTVCPYFGMACEAIAKVLPDELVCLNTTAEEGARWRSGPLQWLRSYWLTGPGYMVPRARLEALVRFAEVRRKFFETTNEDNFVMQWMWSEQRPAWHAVPAIVQHDARVPSTLGFDAHPCRESQVSWERWPALPITSPDFWRPVGEPAFVECPWMPVEGLRMLEARYWAGVPLSG